MSILEAFYSKLKDDITTTTTTKLSYQYVHSEQDIKNVEMETRGQSSNKKWFQARAGRITGSKCGKVLKQMDKKKIKETTIQKLATEIVTNSHNSHINWWVQRAIDWGIQKESVAMEQFKTTLPEDIEIQTGGGLVIHKDHTFLGVSPDGVCEENFLIEIKCPYSVRDSKSVDDALAMNKLQCVKKLSDTVYVLNLDNEYGHKYYHQVQLSLNTLNLSLCKFVIWTPNWMHVIDIARDLDWNVNINKLDHFWNSYVKPLLK